MTSHMTGRGRARRALLAGSLALGIAAGVVPQPALAADQAQAQPAAGLQTASAEDGAAPADLLPIFVSGSQSIEVGKSVSFRYVLPSGGKVEVSSSDESVVSVELDEATQTITIHAHKVGTATVTLVTQSDFPLPHTTSISLKVTVTASTDPVDPSPVVHAVNVGDVTGGTVSSDHASALPGTKVTLAVRPDAGYRTSKVAVTDAFGRSLSLASSGAGSYSFTMPATDVSVSAEFANEAPKWFSDVDYDQWYAPAVNLVSAKGLMNGYGGTDTFGVGKPLTRAELACVLYNYAMPGTGPADPSKVKNETGMPDVEDGAFYTTAANWAVKAGVINGYEHQDGPKTFGPYDPVTFEQLVTIMANMTSGGEAEKADPKALDAFVDGSEVDEWAARPMAWATTRGLVNGWEDKEGRHLGANGIVMRERVAGVIKNAYGLGLMR